MLYTSFLSLGFCSTSFFRTSCFYSYLLFLSLLLSQLPLHLTVLFPRILSSLHFSSNMLSWSILILSHSLINYLYLDDPLAPCPKSIICFSWSPDLCSKYYLDRPKVSCLNQWIIHTSFPLPSPHPTPSGCCLLDSPSRNLSVHFCLPFAPSYCKHSPSPVSCTS